MDINALWNQYAAAHPLYSHLATFVIGGFFFPRAMEWFHTKGVPMLTAWADAKQEAALRSAGFSEDQIDAIQLEEADDLELSAKTIRDGVAAQKAARTATPPAP